MTTTNSLKVILYSADGSGSDDFNKQFKPLTEHEDIIYNEFFNYVRNNNKRVKMVLTACSTTQLDFITATTANPYYVRVVFNGIHSKNEIAEDKNVEFIVPTTVGHVDTAGKYLVKPVICQWINLPKSNKNIGVELESMEIFTNPFSVQIYNNLSAIVESDTTTSDYDADFMVEFWLYIDE